MVKKQSAVKGFTVLGAASILNKLLSVVYVPVLTLMIGDVGNGIANAGYVVYLLIFQITYMGIPIAISKMVSEQVALGRYRDSVRTLRVAGAMLIALGTVLSAATALGAGWIARAVGRPESAMTLFALSPTVLIASFSAVLRGYFQGRRNMTPTSVSQIVEQIANTAFTLGFAWWFLQVGRGFAAQHGLTDPDMVRLYSLQWGAAGSGLGTTAGAVFSAVYLVATYVRRRRQIAAEVAEEEAGAPESAVTLASALARQVLHYAWPVTLGVVIVYSANLVDLRFTNQRLLAAGFSDADAMALYGVLSTQYNKILTVPLALANTLAVVMLPGISGAAAKLGNEALHERIRNGLRAVLLITLPSAAMLAALAEPVIRLLFPRNVSGVDLMQFGSWALIFTAIVQIQTSVLQGVGRMRIPTFNMALALVAKIIVNYVLIGIAAVNIKGAVAGSLVCYGMAAVLNDRQIHRVTGYRAPWLKLAAAPAAAALIMAGAAMGVRWALDGLLAGMLPSVYFRNLAATLPALVVGVVVYAVHIAAFGGVSREEIMSIPLLPRVFGKRRIEKLLDWMRIR